MKDQIIKPEYRVILARNHSDQIERRFIVILNKI